jgi:hypothetical protein
MYVCIYVNPLNAELNPICHLLALLGAHLILNVSRIRVRKTFKLINLTFSKPCIVTHSYNKGQQDALFLKFILIKNSIYTFRADLLSIIRSLNTVYTAIGICYGSYVDCLLARF